MNICKECKGYGLVEFTKEHGGPVCNNCGGKGYMSPEVVQSYIAGILDYPNVYMGGPSQRSLHLAGKIVGMLQDQGILDE